MEEGGDGYLVSIYMYVYVRIVYLFEYLQLF